MDLTEAQWQVLKPLLTPKRRPDGRGRPWRDARAVLNGILWVLRTGAPWHDLPDRYPPYQTCHRRFQQWQRDGTLTHLLHALAEDLRARGKLDLSETFIDASFSSAKKGALLSTRLTAPHKYNRYRKNTQDGRELRRYCRRWKIERLFAWLHNFRRLVSRWEYHEANFLGMLQLGCLVILLRHL